MEVRNIHEYAGWYASYMDHSQGKALVLCQKKKIEKLTKLIETVNSEIELAEEPKEYNAEMILQSIKALINQSQEVEHTEGYFKWEG
jgi:chaperonin cofactor prefoldin